MRSVFLLLLLCVGAQAASVTRIAKADGNWTAAGTWAVVDQSAAAELDSEAAATFTTTSPVYSSTFAPGAIEVDGVAVKVACTGSNAQTGTLTVVLRNSTDGTDAASVTINVADLPFTDMSGPATFVGAARTYVHQWLLVTFSPVTLTAGKNYTVGVSSSTGNQVAFYRDSTAGNWSRMIRTTTTGAPATTDKFIITGERTGAGAVTTRTVTMNNTDTTSFGQIASATFRQSIFVCDRGTLQWATTAASTFQLKVAGTFMIGQGGTVTMGTSVAPIPSDSVARLVFDLTATGDSVLTNGNGGTFKTGGNPIQPWCWLYADVSAGATSTNYILLPRNGGTALSWGAGDTLIFAPSSRTYFQVDLRTNASFSNVTNGSLIPGQGFTYAHPSTNATLLCPVGNLTRNVQIWGESSSLSAIFIGGYSSTNDLQFAEFMFIGTGGNTKEGVGCYIGPGVFTANGCAINGSSAGYGFYIDNQQFGQPAPVITSNVVYAPASGSVNIYFGQNTRPGPGTGPATRVADNLCVAGRLATVAAVRFEANTNGGYFTCTNNTINSGLGFGIKVNGPMRAVNLDNNTVHSCDQLGVWLNAFTTSNTVIRGITSARNLGSGIHVSAGNWTFRDCIAFGNGISGFSSDGGQALVLTNCQSYGESSYPQTNGFTPGFPSITTQSGILLSQAQSGGAATPGQNSVLTMINCTLGSPVTNVNADIGGWQEIADCQIRAFNTAMVSPVEVRLPTYGNNSWVGSQKHDSVSGSNKFWSVGGSGFLDTSIANSGSDSQRITPVSASQKFVMPDRYCLRVPVDSSAQRTISVYVRKSEVGDGAAYNGNQPRLIAKADYSLGVTSDTVIDSSSTSGWEQLTGSTPAVTADGTLLVYVDCDGTAGWINVDDWSFSVLNSLSVAYWLEGFPNVQADNAASGAAGGSYSFAQ